jgi:hypothetical protein
LQKIKNKPDHIVVVYSVSGSIGLDRIQLQSLDHNGKIVHKEILTGNLSTQLVLKSNYDVNVTVLPEDNYYSAQRRFLLYFYIVPKCFLIFCPNMTVDSNPSAFIKHTASAPTTTTACDTTYTPSIRTTTSTTKQTDPPNSSKYDSRIHEHQQSSSKISGNF